MVMMWFVTSDCPSVCWWNVELVRSCVPLRWKSSRYMVLVKLEDGLCSRRR
jgi:hypothetical protein